VCHNNHMPDILRLREIDASVLLERCCGALSRGGLVIVPTDTVYGLAARADIPEAVKKIFSIKGRDAEKALVVMVSGPEKAAELAVAEERKGVLRLGSLWPGPMTVVVRAMDMPWKESVAPGSEMLGIRVPGDRFLLRLLDSCGPMAVTSANPSAGAAPLSLEEIDADLLARVDLAVDAGVRGSGVPSTVVELSGEGLKVLRYGEIGEEELKKAMAIPEDSGQASSARKGLKRRNGN
jgi:L-threonylcarbamoyladenylate synthase